MGLGATSYLARSRGTLDSHVRTGSSSHANQSPPIESIAGLSKRIVTNTHSRSLPGNVCRISRDLVRDKALHRWAVPVKRRPDSFLVR